jgi:hypothetical protein
MLEDHDGGPVQRHRPVGHDFSPDGWRHQGVNAHVQGF